MNTIKITDLEFLSEIKKPSEKQLNQMFDEFGNEVQLSDEDLSKIVGGHGTSGWGGFTSEQVHGSGGWGGS
ncbi:hypothetical protein H6G97_48705 [Nostoc flagelliforme FACHB-838]|uniref:Bacteriocin n=1 Tax=Nostoc flagelliforme FACHB-838 TaxID=2692904 RepID=A0ABR8E880_9NOSO|nr:hypothetical protein [Nostoc flagelliforme]MBD2536715.1 hypothetical protein [Nostoc flagelliforme FACHB-838]